MHTIQDISEIIYRAVSELELPEEPALLYAPIRYTLDAGGKRIRPLLALGSCALFTDELEKSLPAALAIEVFHNFTLLHDDIMDKSSLRRGRDTVHVKWNENVAILSGDAMLIYAYNLAAKSDPEKLPEIMPILSHVFMGICEGQVHDMAFEQRDDVTAEEYLHMISLKTAVLMAGAMRVGAILGGAGEAVSKQLYEAGMNLGIAFQLQDDLLDTYGDTSVFGKNTGDDIASNKKTFLLIKALELAGGDDREKLLGLITAEPSDRDEKIEAVKAIYAETGVRELTETLVNDYFTRAVGIIGNIAVGHSRKQALLEIAHTLVGREK